MINNSQVRGRIVKIPFKGFWKTEYKLLSSRKRTTKELYSASQTYFH